MGMEDIKSLRERTGAGILDCKKALAENNNDLDAATDWLRAKGIAKAAKKADRIAAEGTVIAFIDADNRRGSLLEFNCETDFVALNDGFKDLAAEVVQHITAAGPTFITREDAGDAPAATVLLEQSLAKNPGKTVQDLLTDAVARIGENIRVRRFARFESDGLVTSYIHAGGKIGVLLELSGANSDAAQEVARDVCMHIAASAPIYVSREEVDADAIERERLVQRARVIEEGKPEAVADKIVQGRMGKFFEDVCLLEQKYIKDDSKTVKAFLAEAAGRLGGAVEVRRFARFVLGEGIEKKKDDFAAEVAAQIAG